MTKFITKFAFVATAFAAIASGNAALAESAPSRSVDLSRHDMTNPAEVKEVKAQLRHAARQVCGLDDYEGLGVRAAKMECFNTALAKGEQQVNAMIAYQSSQKAELAALTNSGGSRTIR